METGAGKKVMVAIDESDDSYRALMWVLDNMTFTLDSQQQQQLLIFASEQVPNYNHIFSANFSSARLYSNVNPTHDFVNSRQELEKNVAIGLLEKAKSICTSRGINAETVLEEGDPKVAICSAAEKFNVSLLVVPEQTFGIVKATFVWSLSDYCVRYAKCPVLVVKKPEQFDSGAF